MGVCRCPGRTVDRAGGRRRRGTAGRPLAFLRLRQRHRRPRRAAGPAGPTLEELGYQGIAFSGTAKVPEMLRELDTRGLKMLSIYVETSLDPAKAPYPAGLKTAIGQLNGRETQIWITVSGGKPSSGHPRRSGRGDDPRDRRHGPTGRPPRGALSAPDLLRRAGRRTPSAWSRRSIARTSASASTSAISSSATTNRSWTSA